MFSFVAGFRWQGEMKSKQWAVNSKQMVILPGRGR